LVFYGGNFLHLVFQNGSRFIIWAAFRFHKKIYRLGSTFQWGESRKWWELHKQPVTILLSPMEIVRAYWVCYAASFIKQIDRGRYYHRPKWLQTKTATKNKYQNERLLQKSSFKRFLFFLQRFLFRRSSSFCWSSFLQALIPNIILTATIYLSNGTTKWTMLSYLLF
jgi:hypothetical protein